MPDGQLNANVDQYVQAAGMNVPPPPIRSDPLIGGGAPIEQVLRILGLAANAGDPQDTAESIEEHLKRDTAAAEAAAAFAAQDLEAVAGLDGITGPDQSGALTQQLPQMVSGIAGAVAGVIGGAVQPFAQIPQQFAQGAQQAMQAGMNLVDGVAGDTVAPLDDAISPLLDDFGAGADYLDDFDALGEFDSGAGPGVAGSGLGGGAIGAGGMGPTIPTTTIPTTTLGPPPVPPASTAPASAPVPPIAAPRPPAGATPHGAGIAGMPLIPPGAMGSAARTDQDPKPETKRVSVPPVRNGAPVQGRLIPPPSPPPADKKPAAKPVATRRIVPSTHQTGADRAAGDNRSES